MMDETNTAGNLANDGNAAVLDEQSDQAVQTKKGRGNRLVLTGSLVLLAVCLAGIGYAVFRGFSPKGYQDYTVQLEQYFVEYSEEYDYWDVLTVEYPVLTGIYDAIQNKINEQMYETAMDRVNYWHFHPGDEVKAFQEDQFSIFCSDVTCDVAYHSQYLLSMDFYELCIRRATLSGTPISQRED